MEIKQKKEIISNLDQQLNHKSDALEKLSLAQITRIPAYSGIEMSSDIIHLKYLYI